MLLGIFEEDKVIEAHESLIIGHTMKSGIFNLQFHQISSGSPAFRFWQSTLQNVECPWLQEDPYERKTVYAGPSAMMEETLTDAGDGLFLRKDVPADTIVSFYNGIRVLPGETPPFRSASYQIFLDWSYEYWRNTYRHLVNL